MNQKLMLRTHWTCLNMFEHGEQSSECSSDESDDQVITDASEADEIEDELDETRQRYGLRKRCPFNDLQSFHAVYSFPPDVLHDLFEGMVAQDLCGIIKILDRPQEIKSFKGMKLPGKAVSVWTHIRNFGLIIHQLVQDFDDQVLGLGLELADIVERVTAVECRHYEIDGVRGENCKVLGSQEGSL